MVDALVSVYSAGIPFFCAAWLLLADTPCIPNRPVAELLVHLAKSLLFGALWLVAIAVVAAELRAEAART